MGAWPRRRARRRRRRPARACASRPRRWTSTATSSATRGAERRRAAPSGSSAASCGGPDDDGGVVGEVGEQPAGVVQHLLELAVGLVEERPHLLRVVPAPSAAGPAEVVDEEAVALVGGDPAGAGVGLARGSPPARAAAISLRTVADDTSTPGARRRGPSPTGWAVSMYSSTTARRMAALRSSSIGWSSDATELASCHDRDSCADRPIAAPAVPLSASESAPIRIVVLGAVSASERDTRAWRSVRDEGVGAIRGDGGAGAGASKRTPATAESRAAHRPASTSCRVAPSGVAFIATVPRPARRARATCARPRPSSTTRSLGLPAVQRRPPSVRPRPAAAVDVHRAAVPASTPSRRSSTTADDLDADRAGCARSRCGSTACTTSRCTIRSPGSTTGAASTSTSAPPSAAACATAWSFGLVTARPRRLQGASTTGSVTRAATRCCARSASACVTACGPGDVAARVGGDEFALLLHIDGPTSLEAILERLHGPGLADGVGDVAWTAGARDVPRRGVHRRRALPASPTSGLYEAKAARRRKRRADGLAVAMAMTTDLDRLELELRCVARCRRGRPRPRRRRRAACSCRPSCSPSVGTARSRAARIRRVVDANVREPVSLEIVVDDARTGRPDVAVALLSRRAGGRR